MSPIIIAGLCDAKDVFSVIIPGMNKNRIQTIETRVASELLPFVRRPGRYIGGEVNSVRKDLDEVGLSFALCFPDVYEIAMSHTGSGIIYEMLNGMENVAAERVYAPWVDAESVMREKGIPLFTLESRAKAGDFDVMAFSLTNELCYTNMLNMLDLAGLAVRSMDRGEDTPIVIAGGQMANCCEPVASFVDMFVLGEAEAALPGIVDTLLQCKSSSTGKRETLKTLARQFEHVYVPQFYDVKYKDNKFAGIDTVVQGLPESFNNAILRDLDKGGVAHKPLVPFVKAVHERVSVEIMRGCPGRCRFCQASFCRRPIRYRSAESIIDSAVSAYKATGFDTVSLLSLSTADYPGLEQVVKQLQEYFAPRQVGISLPSLKVQAQLGAIAGLVSSVRKSGLTIAVEAASERLRRVINKPISDEDIFSAVISAYQAGYQKVKLYFMVGFEGETHKDIEDIVALCDKIARLRREVDGKTAAVNAAVSWLVPKAHTPFQWLGQKPVDYFREAQRIILDKKRELRGRYLNFKFHNFLQSRLESAMGRGGRELANVIETAWRSGCRFDLWDEHFDNEKWEKAFEQHGLSLDEAAQKCFCPDDKLPWSHLGGPGEKYLHKHFQDAEDIAGLQNFQPE